MHERFSIRRGLTVAMACAAVAIVSILAGTAAQANDEFEAALSAFRAGSYTEAEKRFGALVEASPTWAAGRITWGQCAYLLGRPDDAEERIERALADDPTRDAHLAWLLPGQLLYKERRFAEAVRPLRRAHDAATAGSAGPHRATASMLGYALVFSGAFAEARPVLREMLDRHGFAPEPAYYLALACRRTDDLDCAVETLRRVADTDFARDPRRKVVEYLARWTYARALAPRNADARDRLLREALPATAAWCAAEPGSVDALRHRGEVLLAAGEPRRLIEELAGDGSGEAGEDGDAACLAKLYRARAHNALGEADAAVAAAGRAVACDEDSAAARLELAVARAAGLQADYGSLADVEHGRAVAKDARAALDRALALDPALGARAESLRTELHRTATALDAAERDLRNARDTYDDAVAQADAERCRILLWRMRDESRMLSEEELAWFRAKDCRAVVESGAPPRR